MDGPTGCLWPASQAQRGNPARVYFIGVRIHAAENDFVKRVGSKCLARQKWSARLHRQIDRCERTRPTLRLEERCPRPIDNKNVAFAAPVSCLIVLLTGDN